MKRLFLVAVLLSAFLVPFLHAVQAADFVGTYPIIDHYDHNISDGIVVKKRAVTLTIAESPQPGFMSITWDEGSGVFTPPDFQVFPPNILQPPTRMADWGDSICIDSIILSSGNHMAAFFLNHEIDDPTDISFSTAAWRRDTSILEYGSTEGPWFNTFYSSRVNIPYGIMKESQILNGSIQFIDGNRAKVPWGETEIEVQVNGNTTSLTSPTNTGDGRLESFFMNFDKSGFSFCQIFTPINDPENKVVTVGYGSPVDESDIDMDGDVDGKDVLSFANRLPAKSNNISLDQFSLHFGRSNIEL